jgi:hypothetical protein
MLKFEIKNMDLDYVVDPHDFNWNTFDWSTVRYFVNPLGFYEVKVPLSNGELIDFFNKNALRAVVIALPENVDVLAAVEVFRYFASRITGLEVDEVKSTGKELYVYKSNELLYVSLSMYQHILDTVDLEKLNGLWPISSDLLVEYVLLKNPELQLVQHSGLYLSDDREIAERVREIIEELRAENICALKVDLPMRFLEAIVSEWAGKIEETGITDENEIFVVVRSRLWPKSWWKKTLERIERGLLPEVEIASRRFEHPALQMKMALQAYIELCQSDPCLYDYISEVQFSPTSGRITVCLFSLEQQWIFSNIFHKIQTDDKVYDVKLETAIEYVQPGDVLVRFGNQVHLVTSNPLIKQRDLQTIRENIISSCSEAMESITFDDLAQFTTDQLLNLVVIPYGDGSRCYTRHSLSRLSVDPFTRMAFRKQTSIQTKSRIVVNLWPHPSGIPSVLSKIFVSPPVPVPKQYKLQWNTDNQIPGLTMQSAYVKMEGYLLEVTRMLTESTDRFQTIVSEAWEKGFFLLPWCADYLRRTDEVLPGSIGMHEIVSDADTSRSVAEQALAYLESWSKLNA